jgi:hypothetical protein
MLGLYYRIWVDCIKRAKSLPANKYNWPVASMLFMSMAMIFNFALFMVILQSNILGCYFYKLDVSFLSKYSSNIVSFLLLFVLPVVIVNYLLIFRKKRYKMLMNKYPYYNGKLFIIYLTVSLLLPVILLWIGIIFSRGNQKPPAEQVTGHIQIIKTFWLIGKL